MSAPKTDLLEQARRRSWYHALEPAPGFETQGLFDLRPYVHHYGLPERMDGVRALEVGCWDGFWSFEAERRTAGFERVEERRRFDMGSTAGYSVRHVVHHAHKQ